MMSWIWTPKYNNNNTDNNDENNNNENNDNYTANPVRNRRITLNNVMKETICIRTYGEVFRTKCYVCNRNTITPFSLNRDTSFFFSSGALSSFSLIIFVCGYCCILNWCTYRRKSFACKYFKRVF